jgi:lysyl-tRNA synthetase class 2
MNDTEILSKYVAAQLNVDMLRYKNYEVIVLEKWDRKTMKEIWKQHVDVDLDNYLTIEAIKTLVQKKGYQTEGKETYEDLFFTIFLNMIEPHLGIKRPIFVYDYPRQLCSLSKTCEHDDRYAERFELYIGGLEVANAFGELVDAEEQKKRLQEDKNLRQKLGKETWSIDEDFIQALQSGIPSASGIALGIDRMVMLFTGARTIDEVMLQSVRDQLT